jgi:redox-regulated HSP33 family molecular chaperone
MSNGDRDSWAKLDIVAKALGALLIPIIIFFVGHQYTSEQAKSSSEQRAMEQNALDAQHETDRITLLLTHLSSTNPTEQKLALAFVEYLANSDQFPSEFLPIVINTLNNRDTTVVRATSEALAAIAKSEPASRDSLVKTISRRPDLKSIVKKDLSSTRALRRTLPDSLR